MVDEHIKEEELPIRLWGIPVDRAISVVQAVGIPTVFMFFICYLAWSYVPTVAAAHIRLLERTGDTLEKMDITLQQSNLLIQEVVSAERDTKVFITTAKEAHDKAQKSLNNIESAVIKDKPNGNN